MGDWFSPLLDYGISRTENMDIRWRGCLLFFKKLIFFICHREHGFGSFSEII